MLTAKGEDFDRVIGLSTGADDYLVKPEFDS
jgi:DNA-binding response OmpR family regulator